MAHGREARWGSTVLVVGRLFLSLSSLLAATIFRILGYRLRSMAP